MTSQKSNFHRIAIALGLLVLFVLIVRVLEFPLTGTHKIRQADTLFTGYSYCIEDSTFLYPKIAHREHTDGIAIGEFPLFSALISLPCQITGRWSEVIPKLITYALWILNLLIWGLWFRRKNPDSVKNHPEAFLLFFIFTPLLLTYLLIPIPDVLAVAILGLGGICWQEKKAPWLVLGGVLFTLAFVMRPYLFPLLMVLAPNWLSALGTFGLCGVVYLIWFKYWIHHTQIWYYLTDTKALSSLLDAGWKAPGSLAQQILLNHLNYIGLWPLMIAFKSHRRLLFAWASSIAFILLLKGDHFVNHAYYFMATGLISAIAMSEGYLTLSQNKKKVFTVLFVIMGLLAVQHNWRPPVDDRPWSLTQLMEANGVKFTERIAVYDTFNPQTLYLAKRVGWYFEKHEWKGPASCPKEATWALLFDEKDKPSLIPCQK